MRKKIIGIILCLVLCGSLFTGCALFEHNDEKDAQQVVATVDSITEKDESGAVVYSSGTRYIYKSDLTSAMNNYAQQYMQSYGLSLQATTERLLDELVTRELLIIEAERLSAIGKLKWDQRDTNNQNEQIYDAIDSLLSSLKSSILSDFGESSEEAAGDSDSSSTTYPTPEVETSDEDYKYYKFDANGNVIYQKDDNGKTVYEEITHADGRVESVPVPEYVVWAPDPADYPCLYGDEALKSLEREAMRQLVTRIEDLVDADFKATKEDREKFDADKKAIRNVMNEQGIESVYPMLGSTHIMQYLVGQRAKQSILINKLQTYITEDVTVSDDEVTRAYVSDLLTQRETFDANAEAYQAAVSDGSDTILYYLDDSYFFVKHILLPFSAEQTAAITAYKADPKNKDKDYKIMRDTQLVAETVVYPHVNGEDDKENPKTVNEVFNEIYTAMAAVKSSPKEAERLFDEYTYKYNTDSGAFGEGKSYAVKRNDDTGHSGYMVEFYDGAMELYNGEEYTDGHVLPHYVVTDYGVHIMYLSKTVVPGTMLSLDDPLTHGAYKTVRESYEDTIRSSKENSAFQNWQNERITYYREKAGVVHKYAKRYKSLYED
ncbi:MAG: hypothetical protein K2M95_06375 [Clostridiales bacterium]|nr:hypothetical protein [Clostridiales bacterium]